jgi:hypothetical protein
MYEDNGDGTVTVCKTGLVWLKNAKYKAFSGTIKADPSSKLFGDGAVKWEARLHSGLCEIKRWFSWR